MGMRDTVDKDVRHNEIITCTFHPRLAHLSKWHCETIRDAKSIPIANKIVGMVAETPAELFSLLPKGCLLR